MNRKNYFWTCPHCGANLDPGEKCDCQQESNSKTPGNYKSVEPKKGDDNNVSTSHEGKNVRMSR